MKIKFIGNLLTVSILASFTPLAFADNASAAKAIAGILATLNHFPSDDDKLVLQEIAADEGVGRGFRAIAAAVANIQHSATDEDKEIMQRILASERAAENAKALASIVMNLNHTPSAEAITSLQAMRLE